MTKADLSQLAFSQVGTWCYVWGGNGEDMTSMSAEEREKWICKRESDEKNRQRVRKLFAKLVENGVETIRGGDCSGFVFWCMKQLGVWKTDMNANAMYHKTERTDTPEPGDLCFIVDKNDKATHVGVCVGNGMFVHCKGRDVGVVDEKSKAGYWKAFGVIKEFKPEPQPVPPEPDPPQPGKKYVKFSGSVNIRQQPTTAAKVVKIAHKGDRLPYLADYIDARGNGWYAVEFGTEIGYCSAFTGKSKKYTEVIDT